MNYDPHGRNRFFVEAVRDCGPSNNGKGRWRYRVRDKSECVPGFGAKTVAYTHDSDVAEKLASILETGGAPPPKPNRDIGLERLRADMLADELAEVRAERDVLRNEADGLQETMKFIRGHAAAALLANDLRADVRDILYAIRNGAEFGAVGLKSPPAESTASNVQNAMGALLIGITENTFDLLMRPQLQAAVEQLRTFLK